MTSKDSRKRGSPSRRASHHRRRGRAVTIEDAVDTGELSSWTQEPPSVSMGSGSGHTTVPHGHANTAAEPQSPIEADAANEVLFTPMHSEEGPPAHASTSAEVNIEREPADAPEGQNEAIPEESRPDEGNPTDVAQEAAEPASETAESRNESSSDPPEPSTSPQPRSPVQNNSVPHASGPQPSGNFQPGPHQGVPPPHIPFLNMPLTYPPGYGLPPPPPPRLLPGRQVSHLEPLDLSGYELLVSRLSGSLESEPPIPPLYRRFKELNHRVLLGLQDELCYLEEMLQNLDHADSVNRRYRNGVLPASRRHDSMEPNEVIATRKAVIDQISNKLFQYNSQLSGFKTALEFKDAMAEDVHDYKAFLAATSPVVPGEMRFLDKGFDLLCLPDSPYYQSEESVSGNMTPVSRSPRYIEAPAAAPSLVSAADQAREYIARSSMQRRPRPLSPAMLRNMAVGICMGIILPILSFPVISGFASRMTVVGLVALGLAVVCAQSGMFSVMAGRASPVEGAMALGAYGAFMAIVAGTFG